MIITVGKDNASDFYTIGEALESIKNNAGVEEAITIQIKPGVYEEKIVVDIPNITMVGEDVESTIITYGDYAKKLMPDGSEYGTFRTATFRVDADNFSAKNLTFINSAGTGKIFGQAVAVYIDGDRVAFYQCRMLGCQDTLFTAPLPPKKPGIGTNGKGPKADFERRNGRHYFYDCYIQGDVDFIFGGATAFFEECEIFSQNRIIEDEAKIPEDEKGLICGYITAACTMEGQEYGYVFYKCNFTSDCPKESIYLGRPWRDYAKTVLIQCQLGAHIKSEGWHDWNKQEARDTTFYAEYKSIGEGILIDIKERADWTHQLSEENVKKYEKHSVLKDWDV
ncbi:MAG: pectinesterase family protein [Bacteroidales bacterium]